MDAAKMITEIDSLLNGLNAMLLAQEAVEKEAADAQRTYEAKRERTALFGTDRDKQRDSRY